MRIINIMISNFFSDVYAADNPSIVVFILLRAFTEPLEKSNRFLFRFYELWFESLQSENRSNVKWEVFWESVFTFLRRLKCWMGVESKVSF